MPKKVMYFEFLTDIADYLHEINNPVVSLPVALLAYLTSLGGNPELMPFLMIIVGLSILSTKTQFQISWDIS